MRSVRTQGASRARSLAYSGEGKAIEEWNKADVSHYPAGRVQSNSCPATVRCLLMPDSHGICDVYHRRYIDWALKRIAFAASSIWATRWTMSRNVEIDDAQVEWWMQTDQLTTQATYQLRRGKILTRSIPFWSTSRSSYISTLRTFIFSFDQCHPLIQFVNFGYLVRHDYGPLF